MDNLTFQIIFSELPEYDCIQVEITAKSAYVTACRSSYLCSSDLAQVSHSIKDYLADPARPVSIQLGNIIGQQAPAFSMDLLPVDRHGHILLDIDLDVEDDPSHAHRCRFYVETELGLLSSFASRLCGLETASEGAAVSLLQDSR